MTITNTTAVPDTRVAEIRELAARVAAGAAPAALRAMLVTYAYAAGVTTAGAWVRLPGGTVGAAQGWVRFAALLADPVPPKKILVTIGRMAAARHEAEAAIEQRPDPLPMPPVYGDEPREAAAILDELRAVIERAQRPMPAPTALPSEVTVVVGPDAPLSGLDLAQRDIVERMVRRARYDALRQMLDVLDGWIEGARENDVALGRRESDPEQFHADDIRRMVNDAAREVGTREPHRPAADNG